MRYDGSHRMIRLIECQKSNHFLTYSCFKYVKSKSMHFVQINKRHHGIKNLFGDLLPFLTTLVSDRGGANMQCDHWQAEKRAPRVLTRQNHFEVKMPFRKIKKLFEGNIK